MTIFSTKKHPSIYEVSTGQGGAKTYTRINNLNTSPYYRWDNSVLPRTEAFPPKFRMIAYSDQDGADVGGETGGNMFMECCDVDDRGRESCTETIGGVQFPKRDCSFLGMAFGKFASLFSSWLGSRLQEAVLQFQVIALYSHC